MAPHSSTLAWKIPWTEELEGCGPWGRWGSDTTEQLHFPFSLSCIGEGNGNPLQSSCLENSRDGGAWWAAVYRVAQSQTWLKRLSSSSSSSRGTRILQVVWCGQKVLGKKKVCCLPGTALGSGWIRHIRSLPWSRFSSSVEKQIISNSRNNFRFSRVLEKKNNKWDKYSVLYLAREGLPEVAPSELKPEIWNNQPGKRQWGAL